MAKKSVKNKKESKPILPVESDIHPEDLEKKITELKQAEAVTPETSIKKNHPLLDQANEFLRAGNLQGAIDALLNLSMQVAPYQCAQILCQVSSLLKNANPKKALEFAINATKVEAFFAFTWINLSFMYLHAKMIPQSREAGLKALENRITPQQLVDIGRHLSQIGGAELKSLEAVAKGYKLSNESIQLASYTLRVALQNADWNLSERIIKQLKEAHAQGKTKEIGETPRTHLLWCNDEVLNIKVISNFAEKNYPVRQPINLKALTPYKNRKLRIGYISNDFREHPTSILALGMMRFHDRDRFEFFGYCKSYDDGSVLRREMTSRFNYFRSISQLNDRAAAQLVMNDQIDVLIDLNGLTEGSGSDILGWRPAPVQMSYLGFPGTGGGRFIDYIIADNYIVPPGAEKNYPEKIIRIPPTYQINDYQSRFLPPASKRRLIGIPKDKLILGMFNNINKVRPETWACWMEILRRAPKTVLWILDPGEVARGFLVQRIIEAGIEKDRMYFAPKMKQENHIARIQHCDLMLDPWPYNGHTTTGDALFAGVPVIALEGTNFASRVSGGLLKSAGLHDLVQPNVNSYIARAITLLENPVEIIKIKSYLKQARMQLPTFDARMRTLQLEAAYIAAYDRALQGLPPDHMVIDIKPNAKPQQKLENKKTLGTDYILN